MLLRVDIVVEREGGRPILQLRTDSEMEAERPIPQLRMDSELAGGWAVPLL